MQQYVRLAQHLSQLGFQLGHLPLDRFGFRLSRPRIILGTQPQSHLAVPLGTATQAFDLSTASGILWHVTLLLQSGQSALTER